MSLSKEIQSLDLRVDHVFSSIPAFYTAAAHTIGTITGGPVLIKLMVEYLDTAMSNVTTTTIDICGVNADNGAIAINAGAIGSVVVSPLCNQAKNASALAAIIPDATAQAADSGWGMVAGLGNIVVLFATVMANANRYSLHIVYQKLSAASLIS